MVTTNGEKAELQRVQEQTGSLLNSIHGTPMQQLVARVSHRCAQHSQNDAHKFQTDPKKDATVMQQLVDPGTTLFLKYTS